jgi:hypothetical protein
MCCNDEMMMHEFMDEETIAAAHEEYHFIILAYLLQLDAYENAAPKRGCPKCGRNRLKPRKRMEGRAMFSTPSIFPMILHVPQRVFAWSSS